MLQLRMELHVRIKEQVPGNSTPIPQKSGWDLQNLFPEVKKMVVRLEYDHNMYAAFCNPVELDNGYADEDAHAAGTFV